MTTSTEIIAILKTINARRNECRDLTFGDTEMYFDIPDGTEIGGGYRSRGKIDIWFNVNGMNLTYEGDEAMEICNAIPLNRVARNDNEGIW